jgi:hypothetical protein
MAATVTVRAKAFGDRRIVRLAQLAQYPGGDDEALGKMGRLWSLCAELQTDKPDVREIRACLGPRGEEHLVESGLGDDNHRDPSLEAGVVRVRGCDECDWHGALAEQRARVEGGRARAEAALRDGREAGRFKPADPPAGHQLPPASSLSGSSSDLIRPELPESGESVSAERESTPSLADLHIAKLAARTRDDRRRKLFGDAWSYAGLKHAELQATGIDPHARSCWGGLPSASTEAARNLFARIDELTEGDAPNWKAAEEAIRNRIDVAAAEARRDAKAGQRGALRWFIPARLWDAKQFAVAKDLSPEQAGEPRHTNNKPAASEQPIRRIKTLG